MSNRLQFHRASQLFSTRDEALTYIQLNASSIPGEPLVAMYGLATNPDIILGVGSAIGKYFIIDASKINSDIKQLETLINSEGDEIVVIKTDIANLKTLTTNIASGAGLNSDGTYKKVLDTILQDATSLADADSKLSTAIQTLKQQVVDGTILSSPKISGDVSNIIFKDVEGDGGIFASLGLTFNKNTGDLTLSSGKSPKVKTYTVNLGVAAVGIDRIYYDKGTKEFVIIYKLSDGTTQEVRVPASDLVVDWEPALNYTSSTIATDSSAIMMKKVYDAARQEDLLYADVKVASDTNAYPHNILHKDATNGTLFVIGDSDSLYFNGTPQNLTSKINDLSSAIVNSVSTANSYTDSKVNTESVNRSNGDAQTLSAAKQDSTDKDTVVKNDLLATIESGDATVLSSSKSYTDTQVANESALRTSADANLQTEIDKINSKTVNGSASGLNNPMYVNNILDVNGNKTIDLNLNISANTGNLLVKNGDGLYSNAKLKYNTSNGILQLLDVNSGIVSETTIPVAGVVDSVTYVAPSLVISFKMSDGSITSQSVNLQDLISDWDVSNTTTSAVVLNKTNTGGTDIDILTADVKIQGYDGTNNILFKSPAGELYVHGVASNINYSGSIDVKTAIDTLNTKIDTLPTKDTRVVKGEVAVDGSKMTLYYGTSVSDIQGYVEFPTSVYMDNTDTFPTSVGLDGTKLVINMNNGTTLSYDLKPLSDKGVKSGVLNADLHHIDLTLLDNTEIHIALTDLINQFYTKTEVDAKIPTDYIKTVNGVGGDANKNVNVVVPPAVKAITYSESSNILTITFTDSTPTQTIQLATSSGIKSVSYNPTTHILTMVFVDINGNEVTENIDLSDLITAYTAGAGLTLSGSQFSITNGGVTETMLAAAVATKLNKLVAVNNGAVADNYYVSGVSIDSNVNGQTINITKAALPSFSSDLTPAAAQDVTVGGTLSSVTATIAANAVTNAKIADDAVTNTKIADNAITNAKIADGTIGKLKLATNVQTEIDKHPILVGGAEETGKYVKSLTLGADNYTITVEKDNLPTEAQNVPWSGVTSTPTTLAGYGITDATPLSHVGSTGVVQHGLGDGTNAGFSTNDYTNAEKTKVSQLEVGVTAETTNTVSYSGNGTSASPLVYNVKLKPADANTIALNSDANGIFLDVVDFGEIILSVAP